MTVPLGDCAETARPPGKPSYAAEPSSGGRDFTNRALPLASSLYAPGGIAISPIAVPKSFRTRDSPSPGDPTPFWRSDSLRSADTILARKSTVSPLSEFPSMTGCDLTAVKVSPTIVQKSPPGDSDACSARPPRGRSSRNFVQRLRLKVHRALRSKLSDLHVPALVPRARRSRSADDASARRTGADASSPLLAEQCIVSLQRALDRKTAQLSSLQSQQSPQTLETARPMARRGRPLSASASRRRCRDRQHQPRHQPTA